MSMSGESLQHSSGPFRGRGEAHDHGLIGTSPALSEALSRVSRAAPLDRPILVIGERGTGKELIAARLHFLSRRWDKPLIKLNCAAISETLLETELFGHEAGAFTGASKRHLGRFELAHSGTLFLDELANCSLRVQEKILRVIEYGEFERVGGRETLRVDVRLIGATNADLPSMASQGQFRADLLDRLAFDVITLPPLRARPDDVMELAEHFALRMTQELRRDLFRGFSPEAERALRDYRWPGNVRELKNVIERAVYRSDGEMIRQIEFDPFASPWRPRAAVRTADGQPRPAPIVDDGPNDAQTAFKPNEGDREAVPPGDPTSTSGATRCDMESLVAEYEQSLLRRALEQTRFNQRKAAEWLSLSYHQLRGYLRKYKLLQQDADVGE